MMDVAIEQRLMLAALLHDIGKFYQRADDKLFADGQKNPSNQVKQTSFNLAQQMCPPNKAGGFGYHHVVWTSQFFENEKIGLKLKQVPGLSESVLSGADQPDNVVNLSCQHHQPTTALQALVQLADWWSAGIDRTQPDTFEKEEERDRIDWGSDFHKKKPLMSVFDFICEPKNEKESNGQPADEKKNDAAHKPMHAFPLVPLSIGPEIFPAPVENAGQGLNQEKYKQHWDAFVNDFDQLPTGSFESFFESLLHLLRKYAWCIPSNTNNMAHVSLYDHLRLSAAFAQCFYRHQSEFPDHWELIQTEKIRHYPKEGTYPVLLVGGDVTGIQDFIYNVSSSKAALSLKGRSFYLQLLIDSLAQRIINHPDIQASQAHVVYASGGKFFMLLPNTPAVVDALCSLRKEVELELWEKHHGKVGVLLEWVAFSYNHRQSGNNLFIHLQQDEVSEDQINGQLSLAQLWQVLSERLQKAKPRLFGHVISEMPESLFDETHENLQYDQKLGICAVTGMPLRKGKIRKLDKDANDEFDVVVEEQVGYQVDLGKALKDADYVLTYLGKSGSSAYLKNKVAGIEIFGITHYLVDKDELKDVSSRITSADHCMVTSINNTDFLKTLAGQDVRYGFRFYGGNEQAYMRDADSPKTFPNSHRKWAKTINELTRYDQWKEETESYVGVLRMDVDNLGDVFINRVPEKMRTFSFYATLSAMLDLFFSGYLNTLRNNKDYRDHVNILYSGGDDLFIIGRWDKAIQIAHDIREKFRLFVRRDDLSISGGITVVHNKFPIRKAAKLAEEAENKAKQFSTRDQKKNALSVFGQTFSMDKEFSYIINWKKRFLDTLVEGESAPRNLLHRLMAFANRKKALHEFKARFPGEKPDYSYKWHSAYSLKRLETKYINNVQLRNLLHDLQIELFARCERNYDLLAVAARWAELEIRFKNHQKK